MDTNLLQKHFGRMGARISLKLVETNGFRRAAAGIDISQDGEGEYFDISLPSNETISYEVVDVDERLRHLLLLARDGDSKNKFLCGHDERHWFVCGAGKRHRARA